ncbi:hypothetical protein [Nocardiopsis ansamitocini]|uniref:Uncharacterized protein n=1 Tax=Nocardiopsis ansamitocini TaxID=1670832 RepID=A0A9W6P567_9ACTN|nr:hypothetical protein [Nocardiopsis ansamitocini]GLU47272.1 hypothetical protein Nans01_16230 [Nocardiopsis ansamitocini]
MAANGKGGRRSAGEALEQTVEHGPARRRWARRSRRRLLVAAQTAVLAGASAQIVAFDLQPPGVALTLFLVLLSLYALLGTQLNLASRWVVGLRLDERQREDRERARSVGYRTTTVLLFGLMMLAVVLWSGRPDLAVPMNALAALTFLLGGVHTGLPAAVLAWRLPDETRDDE